MISVEALRRYPHFSQASDESLKTLAEHCELVTREPNVTLFEEGAASTHLYFLIRGEVDIRYAIADGELRTVDTLVPGEVLVWSAVVEPYRATATGVTRNQVTLLQINARRLRELCDFDADLGYGLMKEIARAMSHRLEGARIQLADMEPVS